MFNLLKRWFGWIPLEGFLYLMMWIAIAGVLGMFDFTTWRFNVYKFQDPSYWSEVGVLLALGLLVFIVTLLRDAKKLKLKDTQTKDVEAELLRDIKATDTSEIREFITDENIERVQLQYEADQRRKLTNLLHNMPDKAIEIWRGDNDKKKRMNRWCRRRARLEARLTPEYLKLNRKNLKARVVKLSVNFIITGVNGDAKKKKVNQDPSKPTKQAIRDNWLGFLLPSIFVAAILAFIIQSNDEELLGIWLTVFIKMLLLLVQKFGASAYTPNWLKATWVADVYFRRDLMLRFKNWLIKKLKGGVSNG